MESSSPDNHKGDLEKNLPIETNCPGTPSSATTLTPGGSKLLTTFFARHWKSRPTRKSRRVSPRSQSKEKRNWKSIVRTLEECPEGYPRLAAFLDSDDCFMIYRRFGFLHSRLLLWKQNELEEVEQALDELDRADARGSKVRERCLRSREHDQTRTDMNGKESRAQLLQRGEALIREYGQLLLQSEHLVAMNRPGKHDHKSVANYMINTKPLRTGHNDFIFRKEDLITLRPGRECAWLDTCVEKGLRTFKNWRLLRNAFCSEDLLHKTTDPSIFYFSRPRISHLVTALITLFILFLLVVPIYTLYRLSSATPDNARANVTCIGVLLVAALAFSAILSLFTKARRHEILGACAAYCAVLVVFIGNVGPRSQGQGQGQEFQG